MIVTTVMRMTEEEANVEAVSAVAVDAVVDVTVHRPHAVHRFHVLPHHLVLLQNRNLYLFPI